MARIVAAARAWLRKAQRSQEKLDATASGPRLSIPVRIADEPQETRRGSDERSNQPFYEMDAKRLWGYYYFYHSSYEHRNDLLYAELVSFRLGDLHPVTENSVRVEDVRIQLRGVRFRLPQKLRRHADHAVSFFQKLGKINKNAVTGDWENNESIRVSSLTPNGIFICQRANYFDQVGTNLTLDWDSTFLPDSSATIRASLERPISGKLPSFQNSMLANTLGTAIMFYDRELKRAMLRLRSDKLASIAKKALHCTVSGVLEIAPDTRAGEYSFDFFYYGTHLEIKMETNLEKSQYLLFPVAFARELPRGGKPQLFFVAIALVDDDEFEKACQTAVEANEYVRRPDETFFDSKGGDAIEQSEAFTYEGYACQYLAEDFVRANESALRQLVLTSCATL